MTAQQYKTIDKLSKKMVYLVAAYELVKAKKHPTYKTAQALFKYYGGFKHGGKPEDLLPQKRGAK